MVYRAFLELVMRGPGVFREGEGERERGREGERERGREGERERGRACQVYYSIVGI